jgi:hypothetical protein
VICLTLTDVQRLLPELELPSGSSDSNLDLGVVRRLEKKGVNPGGFSLEAAKALLAHLKKRWEHKLCTLKQAAALEKLDVQNPAAILFADVDNQIREAKITRYLAFCPGAISGSGGSNATIRVAVDLVHGFCLPEETALKLLRDIYNPKCSPPWNDAELRHKIKSACNIEPKRGRGYLLGATSEPVQAPADSEILPSKPKPVYEPDYLKEFTAAFPDSVTAQYLEIRSQFTCWNRSPAGFLHKVFREGESIWVTTKGSSRGGLIWTHDGTVQNLAELDGLARGYPGVLFLTNPIDGLVHQLERLVSEFNPEGLSFRCAECVTDWRHVVVETDCAPPHLWLKALVLLELPIVAIYHSGGRGPHALVNLGASSVAHWHALLEPHRERLIRLGACPGSLSPLRLSRLPNCRREETGQLQALLYLSPDADGAPIARRPLREDPQAVWIRYQQGGASDNQ